MSDSTVESNTLPPVRTSADASSINGMAASPMKAIASEDQISLWLKSGNIEKLEKAVLDGYGDLLIGKRSVNPQVNKFLKLVPVLHEKIRDIHRAIVNGKRREVQHLIDRKKLAFCREQMGDSPLHKAVLYKRKDIVDYLLEKYPRILHARDHQGRTPLHYAAVLEDDDGGMIYQTLLDAGADENVTDAYGHHPDYYLKPQDELTIDQLKIGSICKDIKTKGRRLSKKTDEMKIIEKMAEREESHKDVFLEGANVTIDIVEHMLILGYGDKFINKTTSDPELDEYIANDVPTFLNELSKARLAAVSGKKSELQSLVKKNPVFSFCQDKLGATLLHRAVLFGRLQAVQFLVVQDFCPLDVIDVAERTPLHYAAALKDKDIYYRLLQIGANNGMPDMNGKTPSQLLQQPKLINLEELKERHQRFFPEECQPSFKKSLNSDMDSESNQNSFLRRQQYSKNQSSRRTPHVPPPRLKETSNTLTPLENTATETV